MTTYTTFGWPQGGTLSNGNLTVAFTATGGATSLDAIPYSIGGKYYFEVLYNAAPQPYCSVGINSGPVWNSTSTGISTNGITYQYGSQIGSGGPTFTNGDTCCVAVDLTNKLAWFRKNGGNWNNSGTANPATGVGGISISTYDNWAPAVSSNNGGTNETANFGASAFTYSVPSGFTSGWPAVATPYGAHRYWRLLLLGAVPGSPYSFCETQFRTTPGTPLLFSGGTPSASSNYGGSGSLASYGGDNNTSTVWQAQTNNAGEWWQYDYGAGVAKQIEEFTVTARTDSGANQTPTSFALQFSDDAASWGTAEVLTTTVSWSLGLTQTFTLTAFLPPTQLQVTQVALEEWLVGNPDAWFTQVALEEWASVATTTGLAFALADVTDSAAFSLSVTPTTTGLHFTLADAADAAWANIEHVPLGSRILQFTGAPDARDAAAFAVSTAPIDHLSFFGVNDAPPETAAFVIAHHRYLSFALNDAIDTAHVRVSSVGAPLSFALNDARDAAAFSLIETWLPQSAQLPVFSGVGWPVRRRPTWRTIVVDHQSGGERRNALWPFPLWEFELAMDGLTSSPTQFHALGGTSFQQLLGFYLAQGGQLVTFLFQDPVFNQQIGGPCGTADGTTPDFLFMRTVDDTAEPASWVTGSPTVYLNGAVQPPLTAWQLVLPNTIVFTVPPPAGMTVTADFDYLFHCRFAEDTGDYQQMMINLFDMKSLKFIQVRDT